MRIALTLFTLVTLSCSVLSRVTPTPAPPPPLNETTRSAEIQQIVDATVQAIESETNSPGDQDPTAVVTSVPVGEVSRGKAVSGSNGTVELPLLQGGNLQVRILGAGDAAISDVQVFSAGNDQGTLLFMAPPPGSGYLPQFEYLPRQGSTLQSGKRASLAAQSGITVHLGMEEDELVRLTDAPPGLFEELFNSPEWSSIVSTTREVCETLSTWSDVTSIVKTSFTGTLTAIGILNVKHLLDVASGELVVAMIGRGFVELCLAATGDPIGLERLTGVVHAESGVQVFLPEENFSGVILGKVVSTSTGSAIMGATIEFQNQTTTSAEDGHFVIRAPGAGVGVIRAVQDGYEEMRQELLIPERPAVMQVVMPMVPRLVNIREEFEQPGIFTQTDPSVSISNGRVYWNVSRSGGEQYIYRSIPNFEGNFRLTVRGLISDYDNNCAIKAGIGDRPGSGAAITFGFTGGGCSTNGPLVSASGMTMDYFEQNCQYIGSWLWVDSNTFYEATLTVENGRVTLAVPGVGTANGTTTLTGPYSVLYAGLSGDGDWPSCSGQIEWMEVQPLGE